MNIMWCSSRPALICLKRQLPQCTPPQPGSLILPAFRINFRTVSTMSEKMQHDTILYGGGVSSCSWRVRAAMAIKNIEYKHVILSTKAPDEATLKKLQEINPLRQIPALYIDGNTLTQSVAIMEYLEETRPEPAIYPKHPLNRAQVRQVVELINSGIQPLQNPTVAQRYSSDEAKQKEWQVYWIEKGLTALEKILEKTSGKYCVGDEVTAADCALAPQIFAARRFGADINKFPLAVGIYNNLLEVEAFRQSHPFNQADAPDDKRGQIV
ncbi:maleylacetoacetate isomerase-like [Paramacrobiotus metropolitanus]|uniref:maleylacetoacetate isomerase-like n=1 Tax=Paramacrobiotus metropolitanus TaxID=2943436 RepID=UPI00244634D1|nr:maleylacetoacetate isomerase-like [Paramacrobiotus metropolitanus]